MRNGTKVNVVDYITVIYKDSDEFKNDDYNKKSVYKKIKSERALMLYIKDKLKRGGYSISDKRLIKAFKFKLQEYLEERSFSWGDKVHMSYAAIYGLYNSLCG